MTGSAAIISALLVNIPLAGAASVVQQAVPLKAQIANSSNLAVVKIGDLKNVHERKLNISGDGSPVRLFADAHFEVAEWLKVDKVAGVPDSGLLRVAGSLDLQSKGDWVFQIDAGSLVLVALVADTIIPNADKAYMVQQGVYHPIQGDMLQVMHYGKIVDEIDLDELRYLVDLDLKNQEIYERLGEQERSTGQKPAEEILEQSDKE
ncbi:MAG: hypothetical protein AB8B63_04230 [Granulosicoccus sp.]